MKFAPSFDSIAALFAGLLTILTALLTGPVWGLRHSVSQPPVDESTSGVLQAHTTMPLDPFFDLSDRVEESQESVDELNQDLDYLLLDLKGRQRRR
jgi:hypothetical protein